MRKQFPLIITLFMSLLLSACGSSKTTAAVSDGQTTAPSAEASSLSASMSELSAAPVKSAADYPGNTILVSSNEHVSVVPDIAEVIYSVRTERKDAATCQQDNSADVNQVIELLKSLNIEETSIQTSDYYMHPIYNYSGNTAKITGYEATTTLTVSDLPIEGLGEILSQSVSTGINTVSSITYMASTYDDSYRQALTAAVNSAYAKAQVLAQAAGCEVGPVINIQETSGYSQARYTDRALASQKQAVAEMALEDSAGTIMPGEIEVEAGILVEYRLISLAPYEAAQ